MDAQWYPALGSTNTLHSAIVASSRQHSMQCQVVASIGSTCLHVHPPCPYTMDPVSPHISAPPSPLLSKVCPENGQGWNQNRAIGNVSDCRMVGMEGELELELILIHGKNTFMFKDTCLIMKYNHILILRTEFLLKFRLYPIKGCISLNNRRLESRTSQHQCPSKICGN